MLHATTNFPRYATSNRLVRLDRGDHVILFDAHRFAPVRIQRAGWDLLGALAALEAPATREDVVARLMPEDALELLTSVGIVTKIHGDAPLPHAHVTRGERFDEPDTASINLTFLVQQSCNLGCVYCLNGAKSYRVDEKPSMPVETARRAISAYRETADPDASLTINFFGGEPMIGWAKIIEIMDFAAAQFVKTSFRITTNLSFLPAPFVAAARRHALTFEVNIDGPQPVHDQLRPFLGGRPSFARVADNVRTLVDNGIDVQLRLILTSRNAAHLHETIDLHRSLGSRSSIITLLRGTDSDQVDLDRDLYPSPRVVSSQIDELLRSRLGGRIDFHPANEIWKLLVSGRRVKQYCGASASHAPVLDDRGDVYNCVWFVGQEEHRIGALGAGDTSFRLELEREDEFLRRNGIDPGQGCATCNYVELCGGPCPATKIMDGKAELFERERRIKCAVTQPIVNFFMEALVNGHEFSV